MSCFEAINGRYACKLFDPKWRLSKEQVENILEYGRLSPSSFGMEPWRFVVVEDQKHKEALRPLCWNQPQITTCSHLVILLADKAAVQDPEYIEAMFGRRGLNQEATAAYIERYKEFLAKQDISCWVQKQCYIAAANMMTGTSEDGIDSCPIEGFEKEKLERYLGLDTSKQEVALLIAFGKCAKEAPKKQRLPLQKLVVRWL